MSNSEYTQVIKKYIQNNYNYNNNNNNINKIQKKQSDHQICTEFFFENQLEESQEISTDLFSQKSEKITFPQLMSNKMTSSYHDQQSQQLQFQSSENKFTINDHNFNINGNSTILDNKQNSFSSNMNFCSIKKFSFELDFEQGLEDIKQEQNIVQDSSFLDQQYQEQELKENRDNCIPIFDEEIDFFNFNNIQNIENSSNSTDFNSICAEFSLSTPSQNKIFTIQKAKNSDSKQKIQQKDYLFDEIFPFQFDKSDCPFKESEDDPFKIIAKSKKISKKSGTKNQRNEQKNNSKNYDKNICKYLTRTTIRAFHNLKYVEKVMELCNQDQDLYSDATQYFIRNLESISGLRVLKYYLNYQEEPDMEIQEYKKIFRKFYKWFLKNRITRYILKGKMEDKEMYIQYKNNVMLKYSEKLEKWNCNKFNQLQ